jgi:hypothetical protein
MGVVMIPPGRSKNMAIKGTSVYIVWSVNQDEVHDFPNDDLITMQSLKLPTPIIGNPKVTIDKVITDRLFPRARTINQLEARALQSALALSAQQQQPTSVIPPKTVESNVQKVSKGPDEDQKNKSGIAITDKGFQASWTPPPPPPALPPLVAISGQPSANVMGSTSTSGKKNKKNKTKGKNKKYNS